MWGSLRLTPIMICNNIHSLGICLLFHEACYQHMTLTFNKKSRLFETKLGIWAEQRYALSVSLHDKLLCVRLVDPMCESMRLVANVWDLHNACNLVGMSFFLRLQTEPDYWLFSAVTAAFRLSSLVLGCVWSGILNTQNCVNAGGGNLNY